MRTTDLPDDVRAEVREGNLNERSFTDGEIYYHIRHYSMKNDLTSQRRWETRLTKTKLKLAAQLWVTQEV